LPTVGKFIEFFLNPSHHVRIQNLSVAHSKQPDALTMRKTHNKLVRDRIPEIIQAAGQEYATEVMALEDYQQALREKLVEEAQEAADARDLIGELADLYEVMDALIKVYGIDPDAIGAEQRRKRDERGGFGQRIRLLWSGAE
jgi:predicted house-cleaning noncanonical NTP pyrophosphatase (MazG superfamily)